MQNGVLDYYGGSIFFFFLFLLFLFEMKSFCDIQVGLEVAM